MLRRIWIAPPLAFARLGSAPRPCQAFSWAENLIEPESSDKTRLQAEDTLSLDDDGNVTLTPASQFNRVEFKDDQNRFFPVCPFFELQGEWNEGVRVVSGPVTPDILARHAPQIDGSAAQLSDVVWEVVVANLKAYHYTLKDSDRLEAHARLPADQTKRVVLEGRTPAEYRGQPVEGEPLVPRDRHIPFGQVQVARAAAPLVGLRLRFYAPAGLVYGSEDIPERPLNGVWEGFRLENREIINPKSAWARLNIRANVIPPLSRPDGRNNPGGLAATDARGISLGLVDDVSDGMIICQIPGLEPAIARIAVGPPDFAPNTRPIVSLQDGLSDRVDRETIRNDELTEAELEAIVHDIFERALETSDLMNKDAQSDRAHNENRQTLPPPPSGYQDRPYGTLWPRPGALTAADPRPDNVDPLPVSQEGQRRHRRLNALEYLKDRLRDEPGFIDSWLRPPLDASPLYDRRMPPLMRNSDRYPMHLTRRQYELVKRWVAAIQRRNAG